LCPTSPNLTHECVPNVLKLSSNVNECKPLHKGVSPVSISKNDDGSLTLETDAVGRCRLTL